jgi:hypothetical protein
VPDNTPRREVEVTLSYYPAPIIGSRRLAVLTVRTRQGYSDQITATLDGMEPKTLVPRIEGELLPYPIYEVLSANGITEVIEHRQRGQTFYISDDPKVRATLGIRE